eukprot:399063-Pyramimonas_sp.AAC.1
MFVGCDATRDMMTRLTPFSPASQEEALGLRAEPGPGPHPPAPYAGYASPPGSGDGGGGGGRPGALSYGDVSKLSGSHGSHGIHVVPNGLTEPANQHVSLED